MGRVATDGSPRSFCGGEMINSYQWAKYQREWRAKHSQRWKQIRRRHLAKLRRRYRTDKKYREAMRCWVKVWRKAHPEWKRRADSGRRFQSKQYVKKYLETHFCVDCGERDPDVLCFHHRKPGKKRYTIGAGWASGILPKSLIKEIRKCDVLCANCHRRRHARSGTFGRSRDREAHG